MSEKKSGYILIDKEPGWTSFDVVAKLRGITGVRKIGHAGTLDPFASGLLIVAVGREATREISSFVKMDKEYIATLRLGATSDTYDREGKIVKNSNIIQLKESIVVKTVKSFVGQQKQIPPMFSAKKVGGQKLYNLARQGKVVKREPVEIEVKSAKITNNVWPNLTILFKVSSGTYIRSLAHDIGQKLKVGAYLEELRRTTIGDYSIKKASKITDIKKETYEKFLFNV